jgi:DNA modification methylase
MLKDSEQGQRRVHPTQKPVALTRWAFEKYGRPNDVIFDPFLGSGISVLAAEQLDDGRAVVGCELAPAYIATTIQRWVDLTGGRPELNTP